MCVADIVRGPTITRLGGRGEWKECAQSTFNEKRTIAATVVVSRERGEEYKKEERKGKGRGGDDKMGNTATDQLGGVVDTKKK